MLLRIRLRSFKRRAQRSALRSIALCAYSRLPCSHSEILSTDLWVWGPQMQVDRPKQGPLDSICSTGVTGKLTPSTLWTLSPKLEPVSVLTGLAAMELPVI